MYNFINKINLHTLLYNTKLKFTYNKIYILFFSYTFLNGSTKHYFDCS